MTERVKVSELMKYGSEIDFDTFMDLSDLEIQGYKYVNIPKGTLDELKRLKLERRKKDRLLALCAERNSNGIKLEKNGEIKEAIKVYERNIKEGCYPALHSFDRLMILYRKDKKYEDEIRVIERAFEVFTEPSYSDHISRWQNRLEKVNKLLTK